MYSTCQTWEPTLIQAKATFILISQHSSQSLFILLYCTLRNSGERDCFTLITVIYLKSFARFPQYCCYDINFFLGHTLGTLWDHLVQPPAKCSFHNASYTYSIPGSWLSNLCLNISRKGESIHQQGCLFHGQIVLPVCFPKVSTVSSSFALWSSKEQVCSTFRMAPLQIFEDCYVLSIILTYPGKP